MKYENFSRLSPLSASSVTITWRHWAMRHSPRRLGRVVRRETGRGPGYGDTEATLDSWDCRYQHPDPENNAARCETFVPGPRKVFYASKQAWVAFLCEAIMTQTVCSHRNWQYECRTRDGWRSLLSQSPRLRQVTFGKNEKYWNMRKCRLRRISSDDGGDQWPGWVRYGRVWPGMQSLDLRWAEQSLAREGGCHCPGRPVLAGQCLVSPVSRTGHVTTVWRGLARHWAVSHPGSEPGPVTQSERSGDRGYDTQYATLRAPGDIVTLAWQCDTVM